MVTWIFYSSGYGQSYDVHSRSDVSDGQVTVESWIAREIAIR